MPIVGKWLSKRWRVREIHHIHTTSSSGWLISPSTLEGLHLEPFGSFLKCVLGQERLREILRIFHGG